MKPYTWAIIQNCRLVGYIQSYSGNDALRLAEKKYGSGLFVERVSLGEVATTQGDKNA